MKHGCFTWVTAVCLTLASLGCCPKGYIRAEGIATVVSAVSARHDKYVDGDESLSSLEKDVYKDSTLLLTKTVEEALSE